MRSETQFIIRLRPVKTWPTSPEQRLRKALKALLRGYGLQAVEARPVEQLSVAEESELPEQPKTKKDTK